MKHSFKFPFHVKRNRRNHQETLLEVFDRENSAFAKLVGNGRSARTYRKYLTVRQHVANFIEERYHRKDVALKELTEDFIRDYCIYLRYNLRLAQSSVWLYSIPLKHIATSAYNNGKIQRNPFAQYRVPLNCKERVFLTENEIAAMASVELKNSGQALSRDLFILGCWTGMSFVDINNLTTDNIVNINGSPWIVSKRQKTGVPFQIKLMDIPVRIIRRYEASGSGKNLFGNCSYDTVNRHVKTVAKMCGIEKSVSFHTARHSFAVMALNYGMPLETISKILGHTKITTTQLYAKVSNAKINSDMSDLERKLSEHFPVQDFGPKSFPTEP